jgi:hypothetical protein
MICRRVDLSQLRIAIALAREANQFAASSPHERSDIRPSGNDDGPRMSRRSSGLRAAMSIKKGACGIKYGKGGEYTASRYPFSV